MEMAFVVDTADSEGRPHCPICRKPVSNEGEFCSSTCWRHFHVIVFDMGEVIDMTYLPLEAQPWHGKES